MTDKELFQEVFNRVVNSEGLADLVTIQSTPYGDCVFRDGDLKFNTEGYNLRYNLERLMSVTRSVL